MNVRFADNKYLRLIDVLCDILPRVRRARMAVAFVKYSGLQLLDPFLDTCLTQGGDVEFIVGLDFHTTDAESLQAMMKRASTFAPQFRFYCYSDPTDRTTAYHPKLYLFDEDKSITSIIGSSNLTRGGLIKNIEVNAILEFALQAQEVETLNDIYARIKYQPTRFCPDDDYIQAYSDVAERMSKSVHSKGDASIRRALAALREKERTLPTPFISPASLQGWQKLVFDNLPDEEFNTSALYQYVNEFRTTYPDNQHIKAKIRQVLQQLRDSGLIIHLGAGRWIKTDLNRVVVAE